ncbi:MAG: hypothetical protein AB1715_13545 [Acidobacteriota bacterium]
MEQDIGKRVADLEEMEVRMLRVERNLYYTVGALFGSLVFLSALFIPTLGRFSALGLTYAPPDPIATAVHLFMALFFISMVVCFYKGLALEKEIP